MSYDYWKAALAGNKPKAIVDQCELGFYRKGRYERNEKGNNRRVGWAPVAVFMQGGEMVALVGDREIDGLALGGLWSYIADNPISEETYRAVAERGEPWPDAHDPSKNKAKVPAFAFNEPSVIAASQEQPLVQQIAEAKAGVSQYDKIDSDTMAGQALSLKNTITSLAGDLDKHREELVRPHIDAQREVNNRLNPVIKDAKSQASALLKAIGVWEDQKREMSSVPMRSDERANVPLPSSQISAAVGRKASVKVKQLVISIDEDKAFAQFKGNAELSALLMALAQKAIDAGLPVPGAVTEERSVVR